ncbi:MAG: hypothetical protein HY958_13345 [Bacteroidia bacterium]|nr:hypothetical protein [Bacteroidia bacterium]
MERSELIEKLEVFLAELEAEAAKIKNVENPNPYILKKINNRGFLIAEALNSITQLKYPEIWKTVEKEIDTTAQKDKEISNSTIKIPIRPNGNGFSSFIDLTKILN